MSRIGRPPLRVLDGLRERADHSNAEVVALTADAIAHVARMRLAMQTRFWTDPEFRVLAKPLLTEIEDFARKFEETPERAA